MKRGLLASALSLLISPANADAQSAKVSMFDDFKEFCGDTGVQPVAVKAVVEAKGIKLYKQGSTEWPSHMTTSIWRQSADGRVIDISVGTTQWSKNEGNSCAVTSYSNEDESMTAIKKWARVAPFRSYKHLSFYEFRIRDSVPVNLSKDGDATNNDDDWELVVMQETSFASVQLNRSHSVSSH